MSRVERISAREIKFLHRAQLNHNQGLFFFNRRAEVCQQKLEFGIAVTEVQTAEKVITQQCVVATESQGLTYTEINRSAANK